MKRLSSFFLNFMFLRLSSNVTCLCLSFLPHSALFSCERAQCERYFIYGSHGHICCGVVLSPRVRRTPELSLVQEHNDVNFSVWGLLNLEDFEVVEI